MHYFQDFPSAASRDAAGLLYPSSAAWMAFSCFIRARQ